MGGLKEKLPTFNGSVDELFTPFNSIKKMADGAINKFCDFIGELANFSGRFVLQTIDYLFVC